VNGPYQHELGYGVGYVSQYVEDVECHPDKRWLHSAAGCLGRVAVVCRSDSESSDGRQDDDTMQTRGRLCIVCV
jgi:hypothetical protein